VSGAHAHALHYHGHSPLHGAAPQVKLAGLILFVLAVVTTPPVAVWAFSIYAAILVTLVGAASIPPRFFLIRLSIDLPFVLFAFLLPFVGEGPRVDVGFLSFSSAGLLGAWNILVKATLGAGASVLLAATTEVSDIITGLRKLKVPIVLTAIAAFMIRYLDVIAGEMRRTRIAMAARGYNPSWVAQIRPLATAAGALFIRSYERGERVHQAMLARGFVGEFPDAFDDQVEVVRWWPAMAPVLVAWVTMVLASILT
jgi:cobalt/nickel transport system permease protein